MAETKAHKVPQFQAFLIGNRFALTILGTAHFVPETIEWKMLGFDSRDKVGCPQK